MTLLVISPDYASHLLPLATIATSWQRAGERVVVATGPATDPIVRDFGFERVDLQLGRGANAGVLNREQDAQEQASLARFFEATRHGMIPALAYQARERLTDLMWQPVEKAREVVAIVDAVRPQHVVVDHLAYSARLGLTSAGIRYGDVVLGHPSALPVADEVYGYPSDIPAAFDADPSALQELRTLCERVSARFTAEWNEALAQLNPSADAVPDAFAAHGPAVLYNYPRSLAGARDDLVTGAHEHLGACVREDAVDEQSAAWLATHENFVYVSLGTFLSARSDVLATICAALRVLDVPVAMATGTTDPGALAPLPDGWLVRSHLPQTAFLPQAAAIVTHAGNNSVTEALFFGLPMLAMPFSTDQFAGAAAIERAGLGEVLDPNAASATQIRDSLSRLLAADSTARTNARTVRDELTAHPGPDRARDFLQQTAEK